MEDEARKDDYRHRVAEAARAEGVLVPTAEILAGRLLRLLRQGREWSQQEVADRMKPFGYTWKQSTVGKIEAAQRPLRVNELADLALLFEIPVTDLLEPRVVLTDDTDLRVLAEEITKLEGEQERLGAELEARRDISYFAQAEVREVASELARVKAGLETLRRWYPRVSGDGEAG